MTLLPLMLLVVGIIFLGYELLILISNRNHGLLTYILGIIFLVLACAVTAYNYIIDRVNTQTSFTQELTASYKESQSKKTKPTKSS